MSSPHILSLYNAFVDPKSGMINLVIEYMDGGSLQDIADQGGCDDEPTLANIAVQALKGLLFLHENLQIHRDLKPGELSVRVLFIIFMEHLYFLLAMTCITILLVFIPTFFSAGNFLISHRGEVKVADLGILKQLAEPAQKIGGGGVSRNEAAENDRAGPLDDGGPDLRRPPRRRPALR